MISRHNRSEKEKITTIFQHLNLRSRNHIVDLDYKSDSKQIEENLYNQNLDGEEFQFELNTSMIEIVAMMKLSKRIRIESNKKKKTIKKRTK